MYVYKVYIDMYIYIYIHIHISYISYTYICMYIHIHTGYDMLRYDMIQCDTILPKYSLTILHNRISYDNVLCYTIQYSYILDSTELYHITTYHDTTMEKYAQRK